MLIHNLNLTRLTPIPARIHIHIQIRASIPIQSKHPLIGDMHTRIFHYETYTLPHVQQSEICAPAWLYHEGKPSIRMHMVWYFTP